MINFNLGQLVATRGVATLMAHSKRFTEFVGQSLGKYTIGDWGETNEEDAKLNNDAVECGDRILAVYKKEGLQTIWIITEWDRSATTILFPEEY